MYPTSKDSGGIQKREVFMSDEVTKPETGSTVEASEKPEMKPWKKPDFASWNVDTTETSPSAALDSSEAGFS